MFLSHVNSIEKNSYIILEQYENKKIIANIDKEFKIISNVCPHQNSLISKTSGSGNRICPYHNWSFSLDGKPITSGRTEYYCKNNTPLDSINAFQWKGLLFDSEVFFETDIDFENMTLVESRIDLVKADYKIIMDLFLDVDHIQSIHAGVYDLIDITDIDVIWKFYKNGSIQKVDQGAYWIALYPYTMIEWQKGSLFITVAKPYGEFSKVFVFKYVDKNYIDSWKLNEQVWETAWNQDKNQAEIISKFPNNNLEPQKKHFRDFLKLNIS
jgi:phenylpropionate dioxygenase-like ring-hydroxylating dioxygenase large terminal subunit